MTTAVVGEEKLGTWHTQSLFVPSWEQDKPPVYAFIWQLTFSVNTAAPRYHLVRNFYLTEYFWDIKPNPNTN